MKERFAVSLDNTDYPAFLEPLKIYQVIPDKEVEREGNLGVIDERGEDYLYPGERFLFVALPLETEAALVDFSIPALEWAEFAIMPASLRCSRQAS